MSPTRSFLLLGTVLFVLLVIVYFEVVASTQGNTVSPLSPTPKHSDAEIQQPLTQKLNLPPVEGNTDSATQAASTKVIPLSYNRQRNSQSNTVNMRGENKQSIQEQVSASPSKKIHDDREPLVDGLQSNRSTESRGWKTNPYDPVEIFKRDSITVAGRNAFAFPNLRYKRMIERMVQGIDSGAHPRRCENVEVTKSFAKIYPVSLKLCTEKDAQYFEIGLTNDRRAKSEEFLCPQPDTTITKDAEWAKWIRENIGPVFFRLLLENEYALVNSYCVYSGGKTKRGSNESSVGGGIGEGWAPCSYRCYYAFPDPAVARMARDGTPLRGAGKDQLFTVKLRALHSDYWTLRETDHRTRHAINKAVVIRAMKIPHSEKVFHPDWPCWIGPRDELAAKNVTDGFGRPLRNRVWEWSEETERRPGVPHFGPVNDAQAIKQCLEKKNIKKVMVIGDSQARSVMWGLKDFFYRLESTLPKVDRVTREDEGGTEGKLSYELRDKDGKKLRESSTNSLLAIPDSSLYYKWDNYLEHLPKYTSGADVIIAGFGSHPASWGQWTFRQYAREIVPIVRFLCSRVAEGRTVVWYGAPSWPRPKTVDNFRATNGRLGLFNGIAIAAFAEECPSLTQAASTRVRGSLHQAVVSKPSLHFVDFFEVSQALPKASKDSAHYDGSVVMNALSQMIFCEICFSR